MAFQLSYPGAPMIYYGGETGIEGDFAEDGRRTMPWDSLDHELIAKFKHAIHVRRGSAALRVGEVEAVVIDDAQKVYAFKRWSGRRSGLLRLQRQRRSRSDRAAVSPRRLGATRSKAITPSKRVTGRWSRGWSRAARRGSCGAAIMDRRVER